MPSGEPTSPASAQPNGPLAGRVAVVSGGTAGNGEAIAARLAAAGAGVFIFGRNQGELDHTLQALAHAGHRVAGTTGDQADPAAVRRIFAAVDDAFGRVDILVNNAGVPAGSLLTPDDQRWRYELHADLDGYIDCTRQALSRIRRHPQGHIVNIGAVLPRTRAPAPTLLVAAKAAIRAYSETLRRELAPMGIAVSLVEPDRVGTRFFAAHSELSDPRMQGARQAEGSMITPEDVAAAVWFCVDPSSRCSVSLVRVEPRQRVSRADF